MNRGRGGLELNDDPAFQKKFWIVERAAWVVFALIMLAALVGLTGYGGYWSRATASAGTAMGAQPAWAGTLGAGKACDIGK